ncbi:MAG: non-canonical purine NTP phosphatase [Anaerolineaceae bacterium]|nr:MAG: non-canonical purine NTP phosphatase [Anaerolineaceae bacterium]
MQIVVASQNPVKINAARAAFELAFPDTPLEVTGLSASSGVSDQPMSDAETQQGAINRAEAARRLHPSADYWVGIEGGIEPRGEMLFCFAWMVVCGDARRGQARTAAFALPDEVARLVREGLELGDADDVVFGGQNSKQKNGSVGILTGDRLTRMTFYTPAILLALVPFLNPSLHFGTPATKNP